MLVYCCCPTWFGKPPPKKATLKLIKKVTEAKTFQTGMVPKEDANCAICLEEYVDGDKLRFLRFSHHFHDTCIIEWLTKNKVCPFCKKEIDATDEGEGTTAKKQGGGGTSTEDISQANNTNNNSNNDTIIQVPLDDLEDSDEEDGDEDTDAGEEVPLQRNRAIGVV